MRSVVLVAAALLACAPSLPPDASSPSAPPPPVVAIPPNAPLPPPWASTLGIVVPGGEYTMGRDGWMEAEEPAHRVQVAPFMIDVTEVTLAQYGACAAARVCAPPGTTVTAILGDKPADVARRSALCNANWPDRGAHPVNCVTWYDAAQFCAWVGKRLPHEEEWEYAARFPDGRKYPWGPEPAVDQGCWQGTPQTGTCPVGTHPAARSALGIHDLAGNVWEMTASVWRHDYKPSTQPLGSLFTERGGSFFEGYLDTYFISTTRRLIRPDERTENLGFRCAR